jgi:hypothetical protein
MTRRSAQTIYYSLAGSLPRTLVESLTAVFTQAQIATVTAGADGSARAAAE